MIPSWGNNMTQKQPASLASILSALGGLSVNELKAVRAAADRLLGAPAATTGPLWGIVTAQLGVKLPYDRFQKTAAYKAWVKNEPLVVSFVAATWPNLSKVEGLALMNYLIEMLLTDLKGRGVPVTVGTVALNLGSLPYLLDHAFPDYRKSGMAHLILKAMVRK
jgi:hypothetical protein